MVINNAMNTIFLSLFVLLSGTGEITTQNDLVKVETLYGTWKVDKFYSVPNCITEADNYMTPAQAKTYLKKTISIQKSNAIIFNNDCSTVNYHASRENAFEYFHSNYRMVANSITGNGTRGLHKEILGIKVDSIDLVEMQCNELYYDLIALNNEELILVYKSTFFFLRRVENKTQGVSYKGTGSTTKELSLTGNETVLKLSYEFFKDPDQLVIEDQSGKELFKTERLATKGINSTSVKLSGVTKLIFKVKSEQPNSLWRFKVELQ